MRRVDTRFGILYFRFCFGSRNEENREKHSTRVCKSWGFGHRTSSYPMTVDAGPVPLWRNTRSLTLSDNAIDGLPPTRVWNH